MMTLGEALEAHGGLAMARHSVLLSAFQAEREGYATGMGAVNCSPERIERLRAEILRRMRESPNG